MFSKSLSEVSLSFAHVARRVVTTVHLVDRPRLVVGAVLTILRDKAFSDGARSCECSHISGFPEIVRWLYLGCMKTDANIRNSFSWPECLLTPSN